MNGVIWSKTQKTFIPISNVPTYAAMQQERLRQTRAIEAHNFQLQNLTLTSFQEPHFFQFYDNNAKVTGLCGETWNLLSEMLNFTLQPMKANVDYLGKPVLTQENKLSFDGLLGIIFHNETIAIPKLETLPRRLLAVDFATPFWINNYQLYIRSDMIKDNMWVAKVFSWKVWCIVLVTYVLLSLCTFLIQYIFRQRNKDKYKNVTFGEHLFYNFGNLCNQGYIPQYPNGKSRILEVTLGLFCSIIFMSFGALLFIYLTKSTIVLPFDSFSSLVANTKYNVIGLTNTTTASMLMFSDKDPIPEVRKTKRLSIASTIKDMHKMACFSKKKKYAILQADEMHKANGDIACHLINVGDSYGQAWIASGIVKNFKYKRTIDLGLLKLMEIGLLKLLKNRWLENGIKRNYGNITPQPIEMHQVSLINATMWCGAIIAFIIFIIEKIVYAYQLKQL